MSSSAPTDNPYAALVDQNFFHVPAFTLQSGVILKDVQVAYKTWGKLNSAGTNVLVVCHALTGNSDLETWWGPLLGVDLALDPTRWFIFCANVIGSPYGTVSSVTRDEKGRVRGPEMPGSTVKDDVRLHYQVLQSLGVQSVAAVIGGSMGGMTCVEYPLNTPPGFVRHIIPIATSARHSAWCISWGEAQRQSIYSDPEYQDGYYYELPNGQIDLTRQPVRGLAAARMAALLTYRSRDSFESRFGRRAGLVNKGVPKGGVRIMGGRESTDPNEPGTADENRTTGAAWREHNDGHRSSSRSDGGRSDTSGDSDEVKEPSKVFSAQSYLRYQGDKFSGRFDANCYIHITRKLDTHDLSHPSTSTSPPNLSCKLPAVKPDADATTLQDALQYALSLLPPALVIGVESDGLFTTTEQKELAASIPESELVLIPSPDGHDGFLLEFEAINGWIEGWLRRKVPEFYSTREIPVEDYGKGQDGLSIKKDNVFGEAEVADMTRW